MFRCCKELYSGAFRVHCFSSLWGGSFSQVDERLCPRSGGRLFFLDARRGRRLQAIGSEPALEHLFVEGTGLIFALELD